MSKRNPEYVNAFIEQVRQGMPCGWPMVKVGIDGPTQGGSWFLDFAHEDYLLVVEHRPQQGWGISVPPHSLGEGPTEVIAESDAAVERVIDLLRSKQTAVAAPPYHAPIVLEIKRLEADEDKLSEEDRARLYRLRDERTRQCFESAPRPTCCQAARESRSLVYSVSPDGSAASGEWALPDHDHRWFIGAPLRDHSLGRPAAKFCPFCGERFGPMRRMRNPPKDIVVVSEGGDYCETCHDRHDCLCLPPSAAYEHDV